MDELVVSFFEAKNEEKLNLILSIILHFNPFPVPFDTISLKLDHSGGWKFLQGTI
jgi:predicted nucleic acid-binding protein